MREPEAPIGDDTRRWQLTRCWKALQCPCGPDIVAARQGGTGCVCSYDSRNLDFTYLNELKREGPSMELVTGFIGFASHDIATFQHYDFLLTCTDEYANMFRHAGIETYKVTHVFDSVVLDYVAFATPRTRRSCLTEAGEPSLFDVAERIERTFVLHADQPAVHVGGTTHTYQQLRDRTVAIHELVESVSARDERLIGVVAVDTLDTYASILATAAPGARTR